MKGHKESSHLISLYFIPSEISTLQTPLPGIQYSPLNTFNYRSPLPNTLPVLGPNIMDNSTTLLYYNVPIITKDGLSFLFRRIGGITMTNKGDIMD